MSLIDLIIYLGRLRSAMDDLQELGERGVFVSAASDSLADVVGVLEDSIKAHPQGGQFLAFNLIELAASPAYEPEEQNG